MGSTALNPPAHDSRLCLEAWVQLLELLGAVSLELWVPMLHSRSMRRLLAANNTYDAYPPLRNRPTQNKNVQKPFRSTRRRTVSDHAYLKRPIPSNLARQELLHRVRYGRGNVH